MARDHIAATDVTCPTCGAAPGVHCRPASHRGRCCHRRGPAAAEINRMHGRLSTLAHNLAIAGGLQRAWNLAADYFVFDEGRWVTWVPGCGLPTERYPMRRSEP